MEFLSQASFICLAEYCLGACRQPAGVTVPGALPLWRRIVEALPNCSVFFLSVTLVSASRVSQKGMQLQPNDEQDRCYSGETNSASGARKIVCISNRRAELAPLIRLENRCRAGLSLVCWYTLPFATLLSHRSRRTRVCGIKTAKIVRGALWGIDGL